MAQSHDEPPIDTENAVDDDRRKFLATCGKFAVVTPPALTVLLSTSLTSNAIAQSGGGQNGGGSNGGGSNGGGQNGGGGGGRGRDHGATPGGQDFLNWLERLLGKLF